MKIAIYLENLQSFSGAITMPKIFSTSLDFPEESIKMKHFADNIYEEVMQQREYICYAFIGETGCRPSEIEQVEKTNPDGTMSWYLQKRQS